MPLLTDDEFFAASPPAPAPPTASVTGSPGQSRLLSDAEFFGAAPGAGAGRLLTDDEFLGSKPAAPAFDASSAQPLPGAPGGPAVPPPPDFSPRSLSQGLFGAENVPTGKELTQETGIPQVLTVPASAVGKAAAGAAGYVTSPEGAAMTGAAFTPAAPAVYAKWAYDLIKGGYTSLADLYDIVGSKVREDFNQQIVRANNLPAAPPDTSTDDQAQRIAEDAVNTALGLYLGTGSGLHALEGAHNILAYRGPEPEIPPPSTQPGPEKTPPAPNQASRNPPAGPESGKTVDLPKSEISQDALAELQAQMTANQVRPAGIRLPGIEMAEELRNQPEPTEATPTGQNPTEPVTGTIVPESPTAPAAAPLARPTGEGSGVRGGFFIRPRPDGVPDILDDIQTLGGIRPPGPEDTGGEYDGWREAMTGTARLLIKSDAAHTPDTIIGELHDLNEGNAWQRIQTPDDLYNAISSAVDDRAKLREQGVGADAQADRFWTDATAPANPKGLVKINASDLQVGDTFRLRGPDISNEELTVTHKDPDTGELTIKDGGKLGTQNLPEGAEFYVEPDSAPAGAAAWQRQREAAGPGTKVPPQPRPETKPPEPATIPPKTETVAPVPATAPATADPIEALLNRAIEATDPLGAAKRGELQGGLALPKWISQTVANATLRGVLGAYRATRSLGRAISEALDNLRNLKGFNEAEARDWLHSAFDEASGSPGAARGIILDENRRAAADADARARALGVQPSPAAAPSVTAEAAEPQPGTAAAAQPTRLDQIKARREEINALLSAIDAQRRGPQRILPEDLKSERYQLSQEARALQREQAENPDYVRDLLKRMNTLGEDLVRARQAGDGANAHELAHQMDGLMQDLDETPVELRNRIYNELAARGEIGAAAGPLPQGRTLGGLTAWLTAHRLDSPGLTLGDRLDLSQRLADEWNAGKDKARAALDRLSSSWQALKGVFRGPPQDTEFRGAVKNWLFEKQWTGLETSNWLRAIRLAVKAPLRRMAMSAWLDADGDTALLQSQRDMVPARFRNIWDTALDLTPGEQDLARAVQRDFAQKLEDAMNIGLIERGRKQYGVPQVWKLAPKNEGAYDPTGRTPRNPGAKLDPRDPFFALHRNNPTYFDGIMAGGVPRSLDLAELVAVYNAQFHDALADRGFIKDLKDTKAADGKPVVQIGGNVQIAPRIVEGGEPGQRTYFVDSNWKDGEEATTADGRPYRSIDHWALRDWAFRAQDPKGNPIIVKGDFLVHPDHYGFLKNELGKSWFRDPDGGGKYFNWLFDSAAFLKASKFASATFHMVTLGAHSVFHAFAGAPSAERGSLLWPSIKDVQLDPLRNPRLAGLMRHGMDLGMGSQRQFFEEGLSSHGGIWSHVPGLGDAMGRLTDWLFGRYMPALKLKTGEVVLDSNLARYRGKLSEDQIYELTANQMNAAFGGQNWRLLGANKTLLDASRLLLTAPDFLMSRAKVVAQALKPYGAEQRLFLLAQAALVYTGARVLNQILNGNPHWEPENALRVVFHGRSYAARFLVSDIANLIQDPGAFWQGRLGPLPRAGIEALSGRDLRTGGRIPVPYDARGLRAAQIAAKDLAGWLVPMGAEGLLPGAAGREQTKLGQAALALGGIGSHRYTAETQMWDAAARFNRSSPKASAQLYQQTRDAEAGQGGQYRRLTDLLDAGQLAQARGEYDALVAEGHPVSSILQHYEQVYRPFTGTRLREAQFFRSLSPDDQAIYKQAIADRAARMRAFVAMRKGPDSRPAQ